MSAPPTTPPPLSLQLGLACTDAEPRRRPPLVEVAAALHKMAAYSPKPAQPCGACARALGEAEQATGAVECGHGHFTCRACLEGAAAAGRGLECAACLAAGAAPADAALPDAALAVYIDASAAGDWLVGATAAPRLVRVAEGSAEHAFVRRAFLDLHATATASLDARDATKVAFFRDVVLKRVVAVDRVVNAVLWQEYTDLRERVCRRPYNRGEAGEVWVKHGTYFEPPSSIWAADTGAAGIDPRYCGEESASMLGKGAYFATCAAYSHGYRYQTSGTDGRAERAASRGEGQLFLVRLAAGRPEDRAVDDGKQPPRGRGIKHPSADFDCVRGHVGGPGVAYASFVPNQAYSAYLVTYAFEE